MAHTWSMFSIPSALEKPGFSLKFVSFISFLPIVAERRLKGGKIRVRGRDSLDHLVSLSVALWHSLTIFSEAVRVMLA